MRLLSGLSIFAVSISCDSMRYFIHLSYRGTHFHGWQRQNNAHTVQGELEKALQTVLRENIETVGCGRTDTGVHAHSYYVHFDTEQILTQQTEHALNAVLPDDIGITELMRSSEEVHARFAATSRSYRYFIHFQKNPFLSDRSYHYRQKQSPDIRLMNEFCSQLIQVEDFSSFEKKGSDNTHGRCTVTNAVWTSTEEGLQLEIQANRFLRNMVRAIVGTSLMVGCNKRRVEDIMKEVQTKKTIHLTMTAPACGLHLWSIDYPENVLISL